MTEKNYEPIDFSDLKIIKIPVKVGEHSYTLVECSEDAAARYEEAKNACAKDYIDGKPTRIEGTGELAYKLLAMCLLDSSDKYVSEDVIKKWPHRVVKAIEARAKEISDLNITPKMLDTLKNAPGVTPDSSA